MRASSVWLVAPGIQVRDRTTVHVLESGYISGCGATRCEKCHSHNTP